MEKEIAILQQFIKEQGLRSTPQRESILKTFLGVEKHVSIDELYLLVKKKYKGIGHTTVYRAMKLFLLLGLCSEVEFGDGVVKYEHLYGHQHHDHLICTRCKALIEVFDPTLEKLKQQVAASKGFIPLSHKLEVFGVCRVCASKK